MGELQYPGVYVEAESFRQHAIEGVSTTTTAFLGRSDRGPIGAATEVMSFLEYSRSFGGLDHRYELGHAVRAFFENGRAQGSLRAATLERCYQPFLVEPNRVAQAVVVFVLRPRSFVELHAPGTHLRRRRLGNT